ALAQVYGQLGDRAPDVDHSDALEAFFVTVRALHAAGKLLAYHDRSDGGLFATLVEMAFASRCAINIDLDELPGTPLEALFNEELGAVLQIQAAERHDIVAAFEAAGLRCVAIGKPLAGARVRIARDGATLLDESRAQLHRAWSATTHALQRLRDNPDTADEEYERIADESDPGITPRLSFDPTHDVAA